MNTSCQIWRCGRANWEGRSRQRKSLACLMNSGKPSMRLMLSVPSTAIAIFTDDLWFVIMETLCCYFQDTYKYVCIEVRVKDKRNFQPLWSHLMSKQHPEENKKGYNTLKRSRSHEISHYLFTVWNQRIKWWLFSEDEIGLHFSLTFKITLCFLGFIIFETGLALWRHLYILSREIIQLCFF